jgi:multicomponent Na+:H+ antiporter subunit D
MSEWLLMLPPGSVLVLGAILVALLPWRARQIAVVLLPALSLAHYMLFPMGYVLELSWLGQGITPIRVDGLSNVWGIIFHIAAFIGGVYSVHIDDRVEHPAALVYAGTAIGAAFAGDLITLFVFWELTAVSSVFLIWSSRTPKATTVGLRYLILQVLSGVILLAGAMVHVNQTGSIAFDHIGIEGLGGKLILLGIGIKAAFPFLHNWLQDAYPEATPTGTVFLSAFTTKLAIYALARGFAGTDILIPIGASMTLFPIVYAVIENDLRRVLAYSLNNQLGFMIVGVGIGTDLALNGTAAHAFAHILYKALLFMAMGAVLHRTGTIKASQLGGLFKSMPLTALFCIIGSLSISGFPGFSGFVSKSMILSAGGEAHMLGLMICLWIASAGVVDHSGIKVPFFAFFAHDSGKRVKEAPANMLVAMGIASAFCIGIGVYPEALYAILPHPVDYHPYTHGHIAESFQLLFGAALAFVFMMHFKLYPDEIPSTNLDFDWVYRKAAPTAVLAGAWVTQTGWHQLWLQIDEWKRGVQWTLTRAFKPPGPLGEPWPTGNTALWAAVVLIAVLLLGAW